MKKIAIIPARSGSKGLVNKNILMLLDKPILAYTIEAAIQSEKFIKVIVSTDSLEYKEIAEKYGAEVVMRGEELSNDSATSYMVIKDVLEKDLGVEYDYFVLLQPTSPFRNYQHINESIEKFEKNISNYDFLVSMTETSKTSTLIKPIEEDESLKHYDLDFSNYKRQNYKEYYPNGAIFIGKNKEYLERKHFFGKKSLAYFMNKADSIDIDDRLDFEFAILLMSMKQKEKQLLKNIENRIDEKKEKFNKVEDITLIGHSIFDNWGIEMFQGYKVNNLGIRGINTIQYNNMIFEKELIKNIGKYVFLMAGTNDIVINNWKKEDTLLWINESIRYIEEMNRNTKIFFLEVPKVISRADRNNKIIEELNTYLKDNLESRIEYISLEKLEDKFGNLKLEYTYDGLHFNEKGYQKLLEILQEEIKL
ncbi:acylneuraminate cytidylyltransferase [Fusobacterium mortiferum]|uniref:cytidylyltransferase domain-containing protein n=1 Tax=Fusobacterium mortiferum TaxID=850 RepID=UPI001F250514|nr:GDSL-type esterase/lipase family protein [Fusobacterium mortiferum]MCF2628645.1 acylneuraminate cytidylyltransferase [Fusobacterium mortiferum]